MNHTQDGNETGVDCGGSCGDCVCIPDCTGIECGPDPADCTRKVCGDDGCGGSCGVCATGNLCRNGQCFDDPVPETLASGAEPTGISVDGTSVYWTDRTAGTVAKVGLSGGSSQTLATGQSNPISLGVDASSVYWINRGSGADGAVMKVPLSGGSTLALVSGLDTPGAMALDGAAVCWPNADGSVAQVALSGGTPVTLATGENPRGWVVALDASALYWGSGDDLRQVALGGGPAVTLATGPGFAQAAVWDSSVFWTTNTGATVMKVGVGGEAPTVVATSGTTGALAVDSSGVYWGTADGMVMKVRHEGEVPVTLADDGNEIRNMVVDADAVYWTAGSEVRKVAKPVCQPTCGQRVCGDDGCGGSCGTCTAPAVCQDGACVGSGADAGTDAGDDAAAGTTPVANPGNNQSVWTGSVVQLDGSGSSDPRSLPLGYMWTMLSRPVDSLAVLSSTTIPTPTFDADRTGDYQLQLVVNNGTESSAPATMYVHATPLRTLELSYLGLVTRSSGLMTLTLGSPAEGGDVVVNISSDNAVLANAPSSVTVLNGQSSATFTVSSGTATGSATITAFCNNYTDGYGTVSVSLRQMTLTLESTLVGAGRSVNGVLTLAEPAPTGGVNIQLGTSANLVATVTPTSGSLAAGQTALPVVVNGVANGSATIAAQILGYSPAPRLVSVTDSFVVNLPVNTTLAPGQSLPFPVSLSSPAPAGGVNVALVSATPSIATVPASVFVAQGATTPVSQPQVTGVGLGSTQIAGSAPGYAPDTRTVNVRLVATFSPTQVMTYPTRTANVSLNLSAPAPAGGVTLTLTSDDPLVANAPASAVFAQGQSTSALVVTSGVTGTTSIHATGTGITEAVLPVDVGPTPAIAIYDSSVGKQLQSNNGGGSLAAPAPAGNLQVTFTSSDPARLLLGTSAGDTGHASVNVTVPAGSTSIPGVYLLGLDSSGTVQLTATAPGYLVGSATVNLAPSGFYFWSSGDFSTTSASLNTQLVVHSAMLDPGSLHPVAEQPLRPGTNASVVVTSSDPTVGTIVTSPLAFSGGISSRTTDFDPVGGGTAILSVVQPAGFTQPSIATSISAFVDAPGMYVYDVTIGKDLQTTSSGYLDAPAPAGNTIVTLTSMDFSSALLSTSPTTAGAASINLLVSAGSNSIPTFYVHGLASAGTAQIRATAPGFTATMMTVNLVPSGVFVTAHCPVWCGSSSFSTMTISANSAIYATLAALEPSTLGYYTAQPLRPGVPALAIDITSSLHEVGAITTSPVSIGTNQYSASTEFDPVAPGTTLISISTPPGFTTPPDWQTVEATVALPPTNLALSDLFVGKDLQTSAYAWLDSEAPAGNLEVTITVDDPSKALVSASRDTEGSGSITLTIYAGQWSTPSFYVQALQEGGTVSYTASAPGFTSAHANINLYSSGVTITPNCPRSSGCWSPSLTTTPISPNSVLYAEMWSLVPGSLGLHTPQELRPGASDISVEVMSSAPSIASITASPVVIGPLQYQTWTELAPHMEGSATVTIDTPTGFSTPAESQHVDVTVSPPPAYLSDLIVGKDLQVASNVSLGVGAPPGGVDVTVTISDPAMAKLSDDPLVLGGSSLIFNLPEGYWGTPTFYVQALQGSGTVTYTVTAPGYESAMGTITLYPSGGVLTPGCTRSAGCWWTWLSTTTFSPNSYVYVETAALDPTTLNYYTPQVVRPGIAEPSFTVTSDDPGIASVTFSPVVVATGTYQGWTEVDPGAVGDTVLRLGTPAGFSTPSDNQEISVSVITPDLALYDVTVGKDLQVSSYAYLAVAAPPGGVTVTVEVADPDRARLSSDPMVEGGASLEFFLGEGEASPPTFYVQALDGSGTVSYMVSAPGYDPQIATINLYPSGAVLTTDSWWETISTTVSAGDSSLWVQTAVLDPITLNYWQTQPLRAGASPVSAILESSNESAGVVTTSPLTIGTNEYQAYTTFDPIAVGTTILSITPPTGFSTPSNHQLITVAVNPDAGPALSLWDATVGKDMQVPTSVGLSEAAPPGGLTVTISVSDGNKAFLSLDADLLGSAELVINVPEGTYSTPSFYVQALASTGSVSMTGSAPGYAGMGSTIYFKPSGFALNSGETGFSAVVGGLDATLTVRPVMLDPVSLNVLAVGQLRPGIGGIDVEVTSNNPMVGEITVSPVTFNGADNPNYRTTSFHALAAGTSRMRAEAPAGFSRASNWNDLTATVTE